MQPTMILNDVMQRAGRRAALALRMEELATGRGAHSEFEEFHFCFANECHDSAGRFCETPGGGGGGSASAYFTPHEGRSISPGQKVKIYRNLHKPGTVYSVRDAKSGLVLGHTPSIILKNVKFEVHEAGRQKVIAEKKKNVHSFVTGEYAGPFSEEDRKNFLGDKAAEPISYNPYRGPKYYSKATNKDVEGAHTVIVDKTGVYRLPHEPHPAALSELSSSSLSLLVWEFYNQEHDAGGRFTGPGGGGGGGLGLAEKPSPEHVVHLKQAVAALREARALVPANTQEGLVLEQTHKVLSAYTAGKVLGKAEALNRTLVAKFHAADSWLKSDPTPEKVGLVHKLVQAAKSALSYMTGGDLHHFAYMNAAGNILGLAAHFSAATPGKGDVWPPPGWEQVREHVHSKIAEVVGEHIHHGG